MTSLPSAESLSAYRSGYDAIEWERPRQERPRPYFFEDPHVARALRYIDDVLTGRVLACRYVREACARQRRDLEAYGPDHPVYFFSEERAGHVCRFIERLPHIKGPKANTGETVTLEDWECFFLTTVFGWLCRETGGRRFRKSYLECGRGNGKSLLSSGIALYCTACEHEEGAEVYAAATTKEQAGIVWDTAKWMMEARPHLASKLGLRMNKKTISQPATHSVFKAITRVAKNNEGQNTHCAIVDELHAHGRRDLYDTIATSCGKRHSSLLSTITTAGSDQNGICYEVRSYVIKILAREVEDESQFGIVYTIDEGDDKFSPEVWRKANPNWGVSVMPAHVASEAAKAKAMPSARANFYTKHLCVWVNADASWMDMEKWDACGADLAFGDFEEDELIIGLDLASKVDICAKAYVFAREKVVLREGPLTFEQWAEREAALADGEEPPPPPTETHFFVFLVSYLPQQAVLEARNAFYRGWEESGWLRVSSGDVVDFDVVKNEVLDDVRRSPVREVGYDPWQALKLAQDCQRELEERGLPVQMVEVRPNVANFSEPMKEVDALVRDGRLHHDRNPVLRWMVGNVVAHRDAKDNLYPRRPKDRPEQKIDGVVAMLVALSRWLRGEKPKPLPYESRGIRSIGP